MPPHASGTAPPDVPSMLDLIRLSPRLLLPPGGVELYRKIALLTDLAEGSEVLDVACGKGVALEYFVREYGVVGSGVDYDPEMIRQAEERCRETGIADRLHFQTSRADALPYRDEVFDVVVGELGLAARVDPAVAIAELVRVTKPGGSVVLVQLVWKAPVDERRRRVLAAHLGARPLMLVEWKRLLREAGVADLHTEDWSDEDTAFRPKVVKPFPDFAELFSLPEKIGILRRARKRWGWRGMRIVLEREREVHRLLTRERILGLDLVKGRKAPAGTGEDAEERVRPEEGSPGQEPRAAAAEIETAAPEDESAPEDERAAPESETAADEGETAGLPLFGGKKE